MPTEPWEEPDVYDKRNMTVAKDNRLIQRTRYMLTLSQQKIILTLISLLKPTDTERKWYKFKTSEFCDLCGITDCGKNYQNVKSAIEALAEKSIWIKDETTIRGERRLQWIDDAAIDPDAGTVRLRIHHSMRPYLLALKEQYTTYKLIHTLPMKSKYSVRLYELLRSYVSEKQRNYPYDVTFSELRKKLMAEKYATWKDFRINVLTSAIREINEYGDIHVEIDAGNTYTKPGQERKLTFRIKMKTTEEIQDVITVINEKMPPSEIIGQLRLVGFEP